MPTVTGVSDDVGDAYREWAPFYPPRLLCKRFNVKAPANVDPGGGGGEEDGEVGGGRGGTKDVVSQASLDRMMREANWGGMGAGGSGGRGKKMFPHRTPLLSVT